MCTQNIRRKCAPITTHDNFKKMIIRLCILAFLLIFIHFIVKCSIQWCVKMANSNVIEIKGFILLSVALLIKINVKK